MKKPKLQLHHHQAVGRSIETARRDIHALAAAIGPHFSPTGREAKSFAVVTKLVEGITDAFAERFAEEYPTTSADGVYRGAQPLDEAEFVYTGKGSLSEHAHAGYHLRRASDFWLRLSTSASNAFGKTSKTVKAIDKLRKEMTTLKGHLDSWACGLFPPPDRNEAMGFYMGNLQREGSPLGPAEEPLPPMKWWDDDEADDARLSSSAS